MSHHVHVNNHHTTRRVMLRVCKCYHDECFILTEKICRVSHNIYLYIFVSFKVICLFLVSQACHATCMYRYIFPLSYYLNWLQARPIGPIL